tara:strand:- start:1660 stop:2058 length:399 start_codon:yes stop_codon:yes gene_type:complete
MSSSNTKQRYWFIDRGKGNRIGFVEKVTQAQSKEGVTIDYQPISEAKSIVVYAEATDSDLTDDANGTYSNIPDRFIEGLISKVIADGYRDPRNMNVEGYQLYMTEFEGYIKVCRKWLRSNFVRTGAIAPHEF